MRKRRTHPQEFKARVPMEVISSCKTIQATAVEYAMHLITVSQWQSQTK